MKVVCDTNVLISGILFGGHARAILSLAAQGAIVNCISPDILREMGEVLARPKFDLSPDQVSGILQLLGDSFETARPAARVAAIKTDDSDNRILEAAWAAGAKCIVSGDKDLLNLRAWRGIRILSPADFMAERSAVTPP